MATFTGTLSADEITPGFVSAGVIRVPPGAVPTAAADTIDGRDGDDTINGGGGGDTIAGGVGEDTISHPGSVSVIHGDADNDTITITGPADAAVALGGSVYGDAGNDSLHVDVFEDPVQDVRGTLFLYGGAGNDEISPSGWDWMDFSDLTTHSLGGGGNDALSAVTLSTGSAA